MEKSFKKTPMHRLASLIGAEVLLLDHIRGRLAKTGPDSDQHAGMIAEVEGLTHSKKPNVALWAYATLIQHSADFTQRVDAVKNMIVLAPEAAKVTTSTLATPGAYYNRHEVGKIELLNSGSTRHSLRSQVPAALKHALAFLRPYADGDQADDRLSRAEATELYAQTDKVSRKVRPKEVSMMPKPPTPFKRKP